MTPLYQNNTCDWNHARGLLIDANLQTLDIKHMSEFENIYKMRCRLAIKLYKDWLRDYDAQTDVVELLYGSIEGMLLRQQAEHAVKLYWVIRRDFRAALKKYLENMTSYKSHARAA
ncbi:MAG: hypothetical protein AAF569_07440 [Pseudomonadota bacterium]